MYVVFGAGAVGATVGARLVRRGHSVLFCDADPGHVEAMNQYGLVIEGPADAFTVRVRAVTPEELPDQLGVVLLAVRTHDTPLALKQIAPRLARTGMVVSLQDGLNEHAIAEAVGAKRTLGALVTMIAARREPGRIFLGEPGSLRLGELDGQVSTRLLRLTEELEQAESTSNVLGALWAREAYNAGLFATAVADLSTADALAEPRYEALYMRLMEEVLAQSTADPEPFDEFDPTDLRGSIERTAEHKRRLPLKYSEAYYDLVVRCRDAETAIFNGLESPLLSRMLLLIRQIERRERVCHVRNLELLAAYAGCMTRGSALNAVITVLEPSPRPAELSGALDGAPVAIKDNIDVRGVVTTNASSVGSRPPAEEDATVVLRLRNAGAELLCKTNLLEYAAGSVGPSFGMTFNPSDPRRTSGGSSGGSAALVAAGVCDHALGTDTGGSVRVPAAYCGVVGLKPTKGTRSAGWSLSAVADA